MTRVLIVDDHAIFRQGLAELLAGDREFTVAGTAADGEEALAFARSLRPDLVLLDISMPGLDGFAVAERLLADKGRPRVLLLSMHKDPVSARKAFDLGVDGYVLKEEAFSDLLYALRAVLKGHRFFSPQVMNALSTHQERSLLSPREREVAVLIARGETTKEIAASLSVSVKTVETHRQRIMEKLGCHKAAEVATWAVKAGLLG